MLRNCCKVIDLNNQTGATGSFWEDPLGLGQVSLLMFLLQMPLRMRKASVEKNEGKVDTNGNDVSATQLCTVRYGLRSRFSSGNNTGVFSRSQLAMRYAFTTLKL